MCAAVVVVVMSLSKMGVLGVGRRWLVTCQSAARAGEIEVSRQARHETRPGVHWIAGAEGGC